MSLRALRPAFRVAAASVRAAPRAAPAFVAAARFHASARRMGSGETDSQLAGSLTAEHEYELESASDEKPQSLQELENAGVWTVKDIPGSDDVEITRKFGDETLKLTFQVSDLDNAEPMETYHSEDNSLEDQEDSDYITSSLIVSKAASTKSLCVDLTASRDGFEITNIAIFDKALAGADGAEGDWARRSRYMGPQFDTLDTGVQDAFGEYIQERGINESLANFIVDFSAQKEQKDYISWLADVKTFVNA